MQGDALALLNLLVCEFPDILEVKEEEEDAKSKKKKGEDDTESDSESDADESPLDEDESDQYGDPADAPTPTIALVDCGAQKQL